MKKAFLLIASAALALCACNKVDHPEGGEKEAPLVYHLNIQASMDPQTKGVTFGAEGNTISSFFEETDCVYVYNETKKAFARVESGELTALHPSNISSSGTSCTLSGDLLFYSWGGNGWTPIEIDGTDTYALYYQMNYPSSGPSMFPSYCYEEQYGGVSSASASDFAIATGVSMIETDTTLSVEDGVNLTNIQSMFRLHLSFTKEGIDVTPNDIASLTISSSNGALILYYYPTDSDDPFLYSDLLVFNPTISSNNDIFYSLAFRYDENRPAAGDALVLTAIDVEGNIYQGTKDAPSGGFADGKYYYGSMSLVFQGKKNKPTVTRTDGGDVNEIEPDEFWVYRISDSKDPALVSISGDSDDYFFIFESNAVVTLTGTGHASSTDEYNAFIYSKTGDLSIALGSDYSVYCGSYDTAIYCSQGSIKLSTTTGSAQTLTITTNDDGNYSYGIYGENNYDAYVYQYEDDHYDNIPGIAADGFTVSRDGPIANSDGTYTWVYTVTPTP